MGHTQAAQLEFGTFLTLTSYPDLQINTPLRQLAVTHRLKAASIFLDLSMIDMAISGSAPVGTGELVIPSLTCFRLYLTGLSSPVLIDSYRREHWNPPMYGQTCEQEVQLDMTETNNKAMLSRAAV